MGSFPGNWDDDARKGLKTRARNAIQAARNDPGEKVTVYQMGVSVKYDASMIFPPTGMRGCWEISVMRAFNRHEPRVFWRQNQEEAAELFRQSISENIYEGFASSRETHDFVEDLRVTGIVGY